MDLKETVFIILGTISIMFIFIPLIITIYLPLLIWRFLIVIPIAKIFRPNLIPLARMDAFLVYEASIKQPIANVCQVWKLQGKIDIDEFRKHFYKCFLSTQEDKEKYENFYCYFVMFFGYIFKKRIPYCELDLKRMIKEVSLDDLITDEQDWNINNSLNLDLDNKKKTDSSSVEDEFIGKWMAQNTFSPNKPVWEIVILQPSKSSSLRKEREESVVCFKIDHGLCDGYSFVNLVDKLSGCKTPYLLAKDGLSLWTKLKYILQYPIVGLVLNWARISLQGDLYFPKKVKKPQWFISFANLDLELVKRIRRKTKTHFVTVLMSIMAGAMRTFLLESRKVSQEQELPEQMTTGHSLGWPNHPAMSQTSKKKLANHLTMAAYHIPLKVEDPLKRLNLLEEEFLEFERLGGPEAINWIVYLMILLQPAWLNLYLLNLKLGFMRFSYIFSTLMLSSEPHSLLGIPVKNLSLPLVLPSTGINTSMYTVLTSHSGQLELSINASTEIFKNQIQLDRFTKVHFKQELKKLAKVCDIS